MKDGRPRALAVLIAVFLIGILIGAAVSYLWLKPSVSTSRSIDRRYPSPPPNVPPNAPPNVPRPELPEFNLTSEQEQKLSKVWKETGEKLESLAHEQRELMTAGENKREEIWVENDLKVRAELNEDQKAIFDPWVEKFRNWRVRSPRRMGTEPPKENRRKPERR